MVNEDEKQCLECGWAGDIIECPIEKEWADWAGGCYVAVPYCPKCHTDHLANYGSQEAKEARLQFLGESSPDPNQQQG